jgi:GT2 family glycosyltransferase
MNNKEDDTIKPVDSIVGCSLLLRKRAIENHGLFDQRFFLYHEEADLLLRISRDFKLYFMPYSRIWHKYSATTGGENSKTVIYYGTRNGFLFAKKHNNFFGYLIFIFTFFFRYYPIKLMRFLIKKQFRLINFYHKAIWDGIRGKYGKEDLNC